MSNKTESPNYDLFWHMSNAHNLHLLESELNDILIIAEKVLTKRHSEMAQLICEVMEWHSDPKEATYNECDKDPCNWCERAGKLINAREEK